VKKKKFEEMGGANQKSSIVKTKNWGENYGNEALARHSKASKGAMCLEHIQKRRSDSNGDLEMMCLRR